MPVYLVQHGKALAKDIDPDQGLSEEGARQVKAVADIALLRGLAVARIEHSPKTRARSTAEILASVLKPREGAHQREGLKPMDDVEALASGLNSASGLMLVGHLPFLEKLASLLITGSSDAKTIKFQNGGIVCLDKEVGKDRWHIKWAITPDLT